MVLELAQKPISMEAVSFCYQSNTIGIINMCSSSFLPQKHYLSSHKMTLIHHEKPPNPSKMCRLLSSAIKEVFFNCNLYHKEEEETPSKYFNDELEVVSITKARVMEAKLRRKSIQWNESFSSVFYPVTLSELFVKSHDKKQDNNQPCTVSQKQDLMGQDVLFLKEYNNEGYKEEFLSAASHFSCCSCVDSEYFSVDTSFSNGLSFKGNEIFAELKRRSIFHEFSHCEGWPFGLCKRAMLLPPLPKSPSDSWLWCKGSKVQHDRFIA